jgi:hypothetical protein
MNNDIEQLKKDVAELKAWKEQRLLQQISYPLDTQSITILNRYFPRIINDLVLYFGGASGRGFEYLFLKQDNTTFQINKDQSQPYTVNATSDIFTVQNHGYQANDQVVVFTSDTQPTPLVLGTTYFVVSPSALTFKLSATSGGSAINITDTGVGLQFIDYAI